MINDKDVLKIIDIMSKVAGFDATDKEYLVKSRISKRLMRLGIEDSSEYIELISKDSKEFDKMISAITTHHTFFEREEIHFEFLDEYLRANTDKKVKIWSAGCSTGEEPYTIAIHALELNKEPNIRILATDICIESLEKAAEGVYVKDRLRNFSDKIKKTYFDVVGDEYKIKDSVKKFVHFNKLNLSEAFPYSKSESIDIIFCRNVMLYFDKVSIESLVKKFKDKLMPGGYFIVGVTESGNASVRKHFEMVKPSVYVKKV